MKFAVRQDRSNQVVYRKVEDLDDDLQQAVRTGFFYFMKALEVRAQKSIREKDKTGRIYVLRRPSGRRFRHRSSGPGQAHARRFGPLGNSISWRVQGWERAQFGYGVSTSAKNAAPPYARFVEFGTRRMSPRPTLHLAVANEDPDPHFDKAFAREFAF